MILHIEDTFTGLSPEQKEKSLYGIDALITAEPGYCIAAMLPKVAFC